MPLWKQYTWSWMSSASAVLFLWMEVCKIDLCIMEQLVHNVKRIDVKKGGGYGLSCVVASVWASAKALAASTSR